MDVKSASDQLISALRGNPELLSQFAEHPYSTTAQVTGTDETISQKDMSRIVTQVAAQASGAELDTDGTKSLASALMGQSGGSVHSLASALFGGGSQSASSGSNAGGFDLSSILGSLSAGATATNGAPSMAEIAAKSILGGLAARGMASLLTGALGIGKKNE